MSEAVPCAPGGERPHAEYVTVRYPDGSVAFCYDPARDIIQTQRHGVKHYFDLACLRKLGRKESYEST